MEWRIAFGLVLVLLVAQRLRELRVSARNETALRARGGRYFGQGHYPAIIAIHVLWFLAMSYEVFFVGTNPRPLGFVWLSAFVGAELLRWWARSTLGNRWTTRVIVVPGETPIRRGPYRHIPHPNYLAVWVGMMALPLAMGAWKSALLIGLLNLLVLSIRIHIENRALATLSEACTGGRAGSPNVPRWLA